MMAAENRVPSPRPTLVVGLGMTGWSAVRYLRARGLDVEVMDTRARPPYLDALQSTYPEVRFGEWTGETDYAAYEQVVASPGVAVPHGNVVGDIELFAREARAPVIAITGSNGKSTVTMLVQRMLDCAGTTALAGGNIGTPALDLLSQPVPDYYVLELSSFQLETTHSLRPAAAVVLNLSEDHMDRYTGMAGYRAAKLRIYRNASGCVVNRDDPLLADMAGKDGCISFGLDKPDENDYGVVGDGDERWFCRGEKRLARVSALTLQGEQNVSNMLAAMALVGAVQRVDDGGNDADRYDERLRAGLDYAGLPHRCEPVPTTDGIHWINDSKGTNVGATMAAIRGAGRPLVLIAGGQGKGADFAPLRAAMDDAVRGVVLIGEDAADIARALDGVVDCWREPDLAAAIGRAAAIAEQGDTVLFSPACASFDMFDSYAHRGDSFRRLVSARRGS